MDTNGAFKHKSMGVGNKNTIKLKYFKITFSCILHKEMLTLKWKMDQNQNRAISGKLRRAAQRWLLCPEGLVLSYQAQTNPLGTEKQI